MFTNFIEFVQEAGPCLELCRLFRAKHFLEGQVVMDHICYKCSSNEEYEKMRALLEQDAVSTYVCQTNLSKRRVAYIGMKQGFSISANESILCLELADKKPGKEEPSGFHHVEMYPTSMTYGDLVTLLEKAGENMVLKERPHHTTHDIALDGGFIIRLTNVPLIRKIVEEKFSK
jgi:hypothetical protein